MHFVIFFTWHLQKIGNVFLEIQFIYSLLGHMMSLMIHLCYQMIYQVVSHLKYTDGNTVPTCFATLPVLKRDLPILQLHHKPCGCKMSGRFTTIWFSTASAWSDHDKFDHSTFCKIWIYCHISYQLKERCFRPSLTHNTIGFNPIRARVRIKSSHCCLLIHNYLINNN